MDADAIVIGGGAAGLAAARHLAERSLRVILLEARERFGGRVWSRPAPRTATPAELGAEFIHGRARETMALLREAGTSTIPHGPATVRLSPRAQHLRRGAVAARRRDRRALLAALRGRRGNAAHRGAGARIRRGIRRGRSRDRERACHRGRVEVRRRFEQRSAARRLRTDVRTPGSARAPPPACSSAARASCER